MEESKFNKIQNKLIDDENLSVIYSAIMTAEVLDQYDEVVRSAVIDWAEDKDVSGFAVEDTSVADLMDELNCSAFQALGILNAVKKNPEAFVDALLTLWRDDAVL